MTHINTDMMDLKKSIFVTCLLISVCVLQTQAACNGDRRKYECRNKGSSVCKYKSERCDKQDQQCKDLLTSVGRINCRNECPETQQWCELINEGQCISKGETCKCKGEQEYCTDELSGEYGCSIPSDTSPYERCDDIDRSCKKNCTATTIGESKKDTALMLGLKPETFWIVILIVIGVLIVAVIITVAFLFYRYYLCKKDSNSNKIDSTEMGGPKPVKNCITTEHHNPKGQDASKYEKELKGEDVSEGEWAIRTVTQPKQLHMGVFKDNTPDRHTMYVRNKSHVSNVDIIKYEDGRLGIKSEPANTFEDLEKLVEFYQDNELPNFKIKLFAAPDSQNETDALINE